MSVPVWIWSGNYPGGGEIVYQENQIHLGGGITKTVTHEIPFTNYDLTGQSRSRKGTARFKIKLNTRDYAGGAEFIAILRFLQARKEANNEAFYYYNPAENLSGDATGVSLVGRYKVKFLGNIGWVLKDAWLHDFIELIFTEDRS